MSLMKDVTIAMQKQSIDQWDEFYPTEEIIAQDLSLGQGYGYRHNGTLVAFMSLNEDYDSEYKSISWLKNTERALYLHRLAVHPRMQGLGIAKKMMAFLETWAREHSFESIRLDSYCKNPIALSLYEKLGYVKVGTVKFRKGEFLVQEKILATKD